MIFALMGFWSLMGGLVIYFVTLSYYATTPHSLPLTLLLVGSLGLLLSILSILTRKPKGEG